MTFNCPDATIDLTIMTASNIELNLYFIKKTTEMTSAMQDSYDLLKEKIPMLKSVFALTQQECLEIPKAKIRNGKNIFIFDDFDQENDAFAYIFNATGVFIFGTRCLTTMLVETIPTPLGLYHIHNLSMRDLIICLSGMSKDKKKELKQLVNFMGGIYFDNLTDEVTHLVSDTVRSVKYEKASKNGIKVMHGDWVTSVWQKSQTLDISANDAQFESFKLPVFFSLVVTTTGLTPQDRNTIKTHIEDNGGRYSLSFNNSVDILIMKTDAIGSQKFKVAQKLGKLCLLPSWVTDSIENGYSLASDPYRHEDPDKPKKIKASTPTKISNITVSKFNPDNTQLSEISRATSLNVPDISLCETNVSLRPSVSNSSRHSLRPSTSVPPNGDYKWFLSKITLAAAKKAGNVLDGLSFHLNGFTIEESALLGKVLSSLGGYKIDHISDQVTHFIVGAFDSKLFNILDSYHIDPVILRIDWLVKVIQEKRIVDESEFLIERPGKAKVANDKPSPASKKAMKSLSSTFKKPAIPKFQLEEVKRVEVEEESVLSHYLENHAPEEDSNFTETVKFLMGKYVYVHGFSDSSSGTVVLQECERAGAALVDDTFHHEIDYIIAPPQIMPHIHHNIKKFKHIVSERWLEESTTAGECVPVKFYHKPLYKLLSKEKPLKDEIFVVSNYKNMEREYIKTLVNSMGGDCLEILRRTDNPIVISPDMSGQKCTSAKAWDLAVLPVEWLLECYEKKQRVDESRYLLGGTMPTSRNKKRRDSIIPSSQDLNSSLDKFDELDPPIENYGEDDGIRAGPSNATPLRLAHENLRSVDKTPDTPYQPLSASLLCKDMSTPRRNYIKKVLAEATPQAMSPRRKRIESILDTPTVRRPRPNEEVDSPYPQTPDCLKPTEIDYSLRPNSSPESQWFHKRKFEALDTNYYGGSSREKRPRVVQEPDETIPHTNNRYDFFKGFDPNIRSPPTQTNEASKFLPVHEEEDDQKDDKADDMQALTEDDDEFLQMQKRPLGRPQLGSVRLVKPDLGGFTQQSVAPCYESENLVEWRNSDDRASSSRKSTASSINNTRMVPIFAINGMTEEIRRVTIDRINELGAEINDKDFRHLVTSKPNKSEKFLIAVAKGLFVVHYEYVGRCESQSIFIDEAEYELGNPKFLQSLATDYDLDVTTPLFKAPYKWRKWITREHRHKFKKGAFTDIKFIVIGSTDKKPLIIKVIEAGGGRCFDFDQQEDFDEGLLKRENIKNCLVENQRMIGARNMDIIRRLDIKIASLSSVLSYLLREKVPESF